MKKIMLSIVLLLLFSVVAAYTQGTSVDEEFCFSVDGVPLGFEEISSIKGGYDPDQGYGNNFTITERDRERVNDWLYHSSIDGRDIRDCVNYGFSVGGLIVSGVSVLIGGSPILFWAGIAASVAGSYGACTASIADRHYYDRDIDR